MLIYIIKSTVILAVLLLFYKVFLEKENIHVFKRHFLLTSILLAIGIPSITFTNYIEAQPIMELVTIPNTDVEFEAVNEVAPAIDYTAVILWSLYGLGVLVFAIRFLVNLTKIGVRIKNNPKLKKNGFINVLIQDLAIPHTFFSYIFFNKYAFEAKKIPNEVKIHEQTHAKQLHSLDIIIIELLQVVFWFNPLLYVLKNYIKLNHEFLADDAVLKSGTELKKYQKTLLAYANTHNHYPIANAINYSSIKKRFTIMKTKNSRKKAWLKSLLLLPLVSVLIYGFSTKKTVISKQVIGQQTQESETQKDIREKLEEINGLKINYSDLTKPDNFSISLKVKNDKVEMICSKGCAWTNLSFDIDDNDLQAIDEFGMTNTNKYKNNHDAKLIDFMFVLKKEKNKVFLKSYEGTAWKNLSATVPKGGYILLNKSGVILKNNSGEGATEEMIQEYNNFVKKYNNSKNKVINHTKLQRINAIYNLMTESQKVNAETYPKGLNSFKVNLNKTKGRTPSESEFNSWKNAKQFAIWIDGKHTSNKKLNNYKASDIVYFSGSKVHKNARSKKFPQPFQYSLFTKKGFEETYKKANYNNYNKLLQVYNQQLKEINQVDHSELQILKSRLDILFENFSSEELNKYKPKKASNLPLQAIQTKATFPSSSKKSDALNIYNSKNTYYEKLRNVKPHFIKRPVKEQNRMQELFSELGSLYFNLSKENKRKTKRPIFPHYPYVRLNKNGKSYYKLKSELTEEDKKSLPKPPPPPKNQKTGYKTINNEKLYYVENDGKRQYYNKFGDNVYVKEILSGPQKGETLTITEINETPVDEIEIVEEIQETESTSIEDEEVIHEQVQEEPIEVIEVVEEEVEEIQQQKKEKAKTGWEYINNETYYYVIENGKKQYYNRWGKKVTFTDKELNQKRITIDKLDELTNEEILKLPVDQEKDIIYYINGKKASKKQVDKLNFKKIKKIKVKKSDKKKTGEIHVFTK